MHIFSNENLETDKDEEDLFDDHNANSDKILDFDTGASNHNENMKRFVSNYGVKIAIPGFYIQCAKFYPKDPNYVVQIIKYNTPCYDDKKVIFYTREDMVVERPGSTLYGEAKYGSAAMRLTFNTENSIKSIQEIPISGSK